MHNGYGAGVYKPTPARPFLRGQYQTTETMSSLKLKVLRLGTWQYSEKHWAQLAQVAQIVDCESKDRLEFFQDLKGKYSDITNIARTFGSIGVTGRFDAELVSHLPESLLTVSHCGAGYDQVDPQPLTERGIQLSNVTTPVEAPTALTAVYLTLAAMRNFQAGHDSLVKGKWPQQKCAGVDVGFDPEGKVVGILGMGGIGRAIRDRLAPFGFEKTLYYNRSRLAPELEGDAEYVSLDDLYARSDVIMVSVPLNAHTHHMVNAEAFGKMKKGVVIVNTARGAVIDEAAITEALKQGVVGAFGSDVFEKEPEVAEELRNMPNVVSLPHMGTHTYQAFENLEAWVVDNISTYYKTGKVKTIVPEQVLVDFGHPALL